MANKIILPGATIGILAGGQLGKMTAIAASQLGYKTMVWGSNGDEPAMQVATYKLIAPFTDDRAFQTFVSTSHVATLDWENIDVELCRRIAERIPMRPGPGILEIAQDRNKEKAFFEKCGIRVPRNVALLAHGNPSLEGFPFPGILKTARLGYDGKGQVVVNDIDECLQVWRERLKGQDCVLEEKLDFLCEASVIVARSWRGIMAFPVVENYHKDGILRRTIAPAAQIPSRLQFLMQDHAQTIARKLKLQGLLAVEFFVMKDETVLANEMAPRPHNSGHGTIEGNTVSQFEQHVRAVCGLPLHASYLRQPWTMTNFIGKEIRDAKRMLGFPNHHVHIYGKGEASPNRKMGHVTIRN